MWLIALVCMTRVATAGEPDSLKYWVLFEDRGPELESAAAPDVRLITERARERRHRRGAEYPAGSDVAISKHYIRHLNQLGVHQLITSRWMNGVSTWLTPEKYSLVRNLSFVRGVRPVGIASVQQTAETLDLTDHSPFPDVVSSAATTYGLSETQLDVVNAIPPLEQGYNGAGVRLGFLDTEFDGFSHPAFDRLRNEGRLIEVRDFTGLSQTNLHGRNVSSIAAGYLEGQLVGPGHGAEILAATTEYAPTETNQEEDNFVAGLEWLESMGVDVVNVSLGYTTFDEGENSYTPTDLDGDTGITTVAADIAASLGVVMVISAGNWVSFGCTSPSGCWYYVGTPADGDSVIAVGAVDSAGVKASFSSYGPTADGRTKPDVAAMGVNVYHAATGTGVGSGNGTSYSTPLVSGVVAQMLQANPALKPMQVLDILRQSASQSSGPDNGLGWGIIDAEIAVASAIAVSVDDEALPVSFPVTAFPNPFWDHVTFTFETSIPGNASVRVYDVVGREVGNPARRDLPAGDHALIWHGDDLAAGVYVYMLMTPDGVRSGRLVHI